MNITDLEAEEDKRSMYIRKSKDRTKNRDGKELLETMNALNLVILNGIKGTAEHTCHQPGGSSVIDYVCVDARILGSTSQFLVWDDDWSTDLSDTP